MPENSTRNSGKEAQKANIGAAKAVSDTVRTTLGPKGMDKMIVGSSGEVTITNDGVTILDEMNIEHPAAKMIVEIARVQESEVGDGTTTAVIIGGELLNSADALLDKNIHPTLIADGYKLAAERSQQILAEIAETISMDDKNTLKNIAKTAMNGKNVEWAKDRLSEIAVKAVLHVIEQENGHNVVDMDNIKIEKKEGGGQVATELITGILLDKERIHPDMPKTVNNAKIALIESALEVKETEIDAKIQINDPAQLQLFLEKEEAMLKSMTDKVIESGANVVICQKGIDDMAQYFLAKSGIFALRRVKESDMRKLAKATGARIISNIKELDSTDLGKAGVVEEKKISDEDMTFITECDNPKAVTILIRGGTSHVIDEVERAITDALGDLVAALNEGKVVAGAGSVEIEISRRLKEFAHTLGGREQLGVLAFAESLEIIPKTLAENAGLDPIDIMTELKSKHDLNEKWAGINVYTGKIVSAWEMKVIEPLKVKTQAIKSASEVAELILRIDDIIASGSSKEDQQGMPPGMPGMM